MIQNVEFGKKRLNAGRLGKSTLNWSIVLAIILGYDSDELSKAGRRSHPGVPLSEVWFRDSWSQVMFLEAMQYLYCILIELVSLGAVAHVSSRVSSLLVFMTHLYPYLLFCYIWRILIDKSSSNLILIESFLDFDYTTSSSFFKI